MDITARIDELRMQVGELNLELVGLMSQIALDGEVIAPGNVGAPHFVDPGEHVLEVRWSNGDIDTRTVTLAAGASLSVRLQAGGERHTVPVYGAPPPPGAGRGCGCGEPGVPSALSPGGDDQGGPPVGFAVLAGAAGGVMLRRRVARRR